MNKKWVQIITCILVVGMYTCTNVMFWVCAKSSPICCTKTKEQLSQQTEERVDDKGLSCAIRILDGCILQMQQKTLHLWTNTRDQLKIISEMILAYDSKFQYRYERIIDAINNNDKTNIILEIKCLLDEVVVYKSDADNIVEKIQCCRDIINEEMKQCLNDTRSIAVHAACQLLFQWNEMLSQYRVVVDKLKEIEINVSSKSVFVKAKLAVAKSFWNEVRTYLQKAHHKLDAQQR